MAASKRGAFIVIEGLDRSGKSTQAASLLSRLQQSNIPTKLMKFPDRTTPIGKMIDAYLRSESDIDDRAIHLLFSANRWELVTSIERALNEGTIIICDRYAFSGVAFSASKGLPFDWCQAPDVGLPAPDLTLFLDISPEKARQRGGYGEERYEKEEMQRRVREVFSNIAADARRRDEYTWVTIDAGKELEDVKDDIWIQVEQLLGSGDLKPIRRLWTSVPIST
ncbi:thymidylate kinase [Fomitiporia mediterranea MF3/22]|uniref:thymidylate kinase n=1 Tax=Fomitiporia mediterranea (strain MF3/22) TaxID=694068 RepID=UPI0004408901|nr:thymidylate kinase [Fomitiporia mediterranea MF3/22]EJD07376.1 thymidylate kinase [Fomitiporia mediterranea MF3/22]